MLESVISIVMLVISFLGSGMPEVYQVVDVPSAHTVIVCDTQGNKYTYYQDIVTVDCGETVCDIEGQLMLCLDNNYNEIEKGSYMIEPLKYEVAVYSHNFVVYVPYCLGEYYNSSTWTE